MPGLLVRRRELDGDQTLCRFYVRKLFHKYCDAFFFYISGLNLFGTVVIIFSAFGYCLRLDY